MPVHATTTTPPLQVAFSFDTTGSMIFVLEEVRNHMENVISRLYADVPGLEVAVIAHGDYGDPYVTMLQDFRAAKDEADVKQFLDGVTQTYGGDWAECYELVLYEARTQLSWSQGGDGRRVLVMIGDAIPHGPQDTERNVNRIDWEEQAQLLAHNMGVRIYGLQHVAGIESPRANKFWRSLAEIGGGKHVTLTHIESVVEILVAICLKEAHMDKVKSYEEELRISGTLRRDVSRMFHTFTSEENDTASDCDPWYPFWCPLSNADLSIAVPPVEGMKAFGDPADERDIAARPRPSYHKKPLPTSTKPKIAPKPRSGKAQFTKVEPKKLLTEPWRPVRWQWTEEVYNEKREAVLNCKPPLDDVPAYNIMMCGKIKSGKSSVINTMMSAMRGEFCQLAHNAEDDKSVTRIYRVYKLRRSVTERGLPVNLCDTMGFDEECKTESAPGANRLNLVGPSMQDIKYIMQGHIADGYKFEPDTPIDYRDKHFRENPQWEHRIHVLVMVVDGMAVSQMTPSSIKKLSEIISLAKDLDIRVATVVSKVDKVCEHVDQDIRSVFHSDDVNEVLEITHSQLGCIKANIFPMQNYVEQQDVNLGMNILSLDTLQHILRLGSNTLESQASAAGKFPADMDVVEAPALQTSPWRRDRDEDLLPENIERYENDTWDELFELEPIHGSTINIALFGPSGSGKSAFINSAMSVMYGRIMTFASQGTDDLTTKHYQEYQLKNGREGKLLDIVLADTMGYTENLAIQKSDLRNVLDGKVEDKTCFNPAVEIPPARLRKNSRNLRPIHAVAICLNAANFTFLPHTQLRHIQDVIKEARQRRLGVVVLLTGVDQLCAHVSNNPSVVFRSREVEECVDMVFEKLVSVPKVDILPVVNYCSHDTSIQRPKSAIILQTLQHLVERAQDYIHESANKK